MSVGSFEKLIEAMRAAQDLGQAVVVATVVESGGSAPQSAGARMICLPGGEIRGTVGGGAAEKRVMEDAVSLLASEEKARLVHYDLVGDLGMRCGGRMSVYLEKIGGKPRLLVFGAGHVAAPTAALAESVGFDVWVVDDRPEWANGERFPTARRVLVQPFMEFLDGEEIRPGDYLVVVTRGHAHDQEIVERVLSGPQEYLGVIGSRRKSQEMRRELIEQGGDKEAIDRIRCPIGLPLGGRSPEEIAVSIVSELIMARYGKDLSAFC